jgi:hypothetical protein
VILVRNDLPEKPILLIIRRTLGENPTYRYFNINAHASTRLRVFVRLTFSPGPWRSGWGRKDGSITGSQVRILIESELPLGTGFLF